MRRWRLILVALSACLVTYTPLVSQARISLAQWKAVKQQLTGPSGGVYFEKNVKNNLLPPLEGTLVSSKSMGEGDEFLVAVQDDITPEVKLKLKRHLRDTLPPGTPVAFEGVVREFTVEPFMLVFDVEDVNRATQPTKQP